MGEVKFENKKFAASFLKSIDDYIKENLATLSGGDIYDMYIDLYNEVKEYRGNFSGYTGYSELLVFRFIYHLLGGGFEAKDRQGSDVKVFKKKDQDLYIGQSVKQLDRRIDFRPDISIEKATSTIAGAEIKTFLTGGWDTANDAFGRLEKMEQRNIGNFKGCLIIFGCAKKHLEALDNIQRQNSWFRYIVLKDNKTLFRETIATSLGLERISSAYSK
jgi:hypothetical protein